MLIPPSHSLTTSYLNRVFDKTVATYKYYWFLALLDLFVKQGKTKINVWEIMISMVANAWYPVIYFRLSFGKSESLYEAILTLQKEYNIPINISVRDLTELLHELVQRREVRKNLNFLQMNVPFRFLRPWINTSDDRQTVLRSQSFENGCLYRLDKIQGTFYVELNPVWQDYLSENYDILSANSSKSNRLPDLNLYLPKVAEAHQAALRLNIEAGKQDKLWEDYLSLGHTVQEIAAMDWEHLLDCFFQTFTPMHQIALNMGFEIWKYES